MFQMTCRMYGSDIEMIKDSFHQSELCDSCKNKYIECDECSENYTNCYMEIDEDEQE